MGAKERKAAHGAGVKQRDLPHCDPEDLVLVTNEKSHLFDARVLNEPSEEMIRNVDYYGPIEPVLVVKNTETGKYEVADGRNRTKACREANKRRKKRGEEPHRITFIVKRVDAGTAVGLMISLNEQRTADTPMNRARKAARMLDNGKTEEDVGLAFGISTASVKNLIKLIDAPAVVRNAVESGKISTSDGYKLAGLEVDEAKKKVELLLTNAPRTPGQKRSKNAKKARAIVGGGKKKKLTSKATEAEAPSTGGDDRLRAHNIVENVLRELEEKDKTDAGGNVLTRGAIVFAQWLLGDDKALAVLGLA